VIQSSSGEIGLGGIGQVDEKTLVVDVVERADSIGGNLTLRVSTEGEDDIIGYSGSEAEAARRRSVVSAYAG
jgi:hypothetical protein